MREADKAADISELSDRAVECRDLGHDRKWSGDYEIVTDRNGNVVMWTRKIECPRCGRVRYDRLDGRMSRTGGKTEYPEGYLLQKGHGRIRTAEARMEYVNRLQTNRTPVKAAPAKKTAAAAKSVTKKTTAKKASPRK